MKFNQGNRRLAAAVFMFSITFLSVRSVNAGTYGATVASCKDMLPVHGTATPQTSPSPYLIIVADVRFAQFSELMQYNN